MVQPDRILFTMSVLFLVFVLRVSGFLRLYVRNSGSNIWGPFYFLLLSVWIYTYGFFNCSITWLLVHFLFVDLL
jgi:hypothetical protein